MDADCSIEDVGSVLADDTARCILVESAARPMSAQELSDACDVSGPTVYRRLADLRDCDLLEDGTQVDTDRGHHRTVYSTKVNRIVVELAADGMALDVQHREGMADRFTRLVEEM